MAIVVEDGTGLSTADSYLSIADADTYHTNRGNATWTGTDAVKEQALRKVTQYLDSTYQWKGSIYSTTQSLNWPRTGVADLQGRDLDYSVPVKIEEAVAELALLSLSADLVTTTSTSNYTKRKKVEGLEVEYFEGAPIDRQYRMVDRILNGLYNSKFGGSTVKCERV